MPADLDQLLVPHGVFDDDWLASQTEPGSSASREWGSDELLPRAVALAGELAARPSEAYRLAKDQLHRPAIAAIESNAGDDAAVLAGWTSADTRLRIEATLAALARR
ncbi:hypothetical protein ACI797_08205 [Geodermatophilus sp. SYSU D00691]